MDLVGLDEDPHTLIKDIGVGKQQLVEIAKAISKNCRLLILDEPTSNLDTLNEGEILKSIKENCKDKTIVLISHRKSTTAICDKTYRVEDGNLVII